MSKLTAMGHNQIVMGILGINSYSFASPSLNRLRAFSPFLIAISSTECAVLGILYAYQETRLPLMLEAVVLVIGATASLFSYLNMRWKMNNVGEMNSKLQELVDRGKIHIRNSLLEKENKHFSKITIFSSRR